MAVFASACKAKTHRDGAGMNDAVGMSGGCLCGEVPVRLHAARVQLALRYVSPSDWRCFRVPCLDLSRCVEWEHSEPHQRRSSPLVERGFCCECGSPLTLVYYANPREVVLHAGTLDQPERFLPQYNYGSLQRPDWVCCGVGLPHRDTEERW